MTKYLEITTAGGSTYRVTHVRLFPQSLLHEAELAVRAVTALKDLWFIGSPVPLITAKLLVDKAIGQKDQEKIEAAHRLRKSAQSAGRWFEIIDTEIDPDEGLKSIVAWGAVRASPPAQKKKLTFYEKYVWKPLPQSRNPTDKGDFFGLDPRQDFIRIRTSDSEHAVKLSSIESFGLHSE